MGVKMVCVCVYI